MIVREYFQPGAQDPVWDANFVLETARRYIEEAHTVTGVDESGGEARVYFIDQDWVLKAQRPQQLRSWTSLEKEIVFLRQIEHDDPTLPVPRVLGYGREDGGAIEYTLMTRMPGEAAVRAGIKPEARPKALRALGDTIRRIHAISQEPLRASGLFPEEHTATDIRLALAEDIEGLARRIADAGLSFPGPLGPDSLLRALEARVPSHPLARALHTNPGPTHTFVDPTSGVYQGLIDFGDAYIGHPVFDLWQWGDPLDRQAVFSGYTAAGALDGDFMAMWDLAQVLSDLIAVARRRPYEEASRAHLVELLRAW